jgi:2-haloacid dehalogenase
MLAKTRSIEITSANERELKEGFSTMSPYPEVPGALQKLRSAGFRLFTLTNNVLEVQRRQLEEGRIGQYFERLFSVDQVRQHKPAPETYAHVERELGVSPSRLFMIACHTWDTLGAVGAGWGAALIKRPGNDVLEVGPQPTFVGSDLSAVSDWIIATYSRGGA